MHTLSTSFVLGYHGCDKKVAEALLNGDPFKASTNAFDWLGHGIYFWEANPLRGLDYAEELNVRRRRGGPKIAAPAVVGAIIDLGLCLDLATTAGIAQVKAAHKRFLEIASKARVPLPRNQKDGLRRNLDCAVIQTLHQIRRETDEPPIETVRGIFVEGNRIYESAGFYEKTHIQICVCNPDCIKGVFRVPQSQLSS